MELNDLNLYALTIYDFMSDILFEICPSLAKNVLISYFAATVCFLNEFFIAALCE